MNILLSLLFFCYYGGTHELTYQKPGFSTKMGIQTCTTGFMTQEQNDEYQRVRKSGNAQREIEETSINRSSQRNSQNSKPIN